MDNRLYDTKPLALEVRALVNTPQGEPHFAWLTISTRYIEAVSPANTDNGGCSLRLASGAILLCSNSYEDVAEALIGDAKRFTSSDAVEEEMLRPPSPEEIAEMARANAERERAANGPDVGNILDMAAGVVDDNVDLEDLEDDDLYLDDEDYDTGSL